MAVRARGRTRAWVDITAMPTFAASNPLQLPITQFKCLLGLISEPIPLAHIKPRFICHSNGYVEISSTLELLQKPRILLEFGK